MEQSKTLAVSVSAKEFVTYQCSQCGHCCRRIEGCVMVESLDAAAQYIRENAKAGDLVITLGCGDVYKAADRMVAK